MCPPTDQRSIPCARPFFRIRITYHVAYGKFCILTTKSHYYFVRFFLFFFFRSTKQITHSNDVRLRRFDINTKNIGLCVGVSLHLLRQIETIFLYVVFVTLRYFRCSVVPHTHNQNSKKKYKQQKNEKQN